MHLFLLLGSRNQVLGLSSGIEEIGHIRFEMAVCLFAAWLIVFLCLCKGVQSSGKVRRLLLLFYNLRCYEPVISLLLIYLFPCSYILKTITFPRRVSVRQAAGYKLSKPLFCNEKL